MFFQKKWVTTLHTSPSPPTSLFPSLMQPLTITHWISLLSWEEVFTLKVRNICRPLIEMIRSISSALLFALASLCFYLFFILLPPGPTHVFFPVFCPPQLPLPLGLDCGALTSARPPLPPRPPAMASRIGLRMQVQHNHTPASNVQHMQPFY